MSEKEVALFFNFKGTLFSDTSKTERAKTFPPFSDKPHAMQADMGGVIFHMVLSSSKRM